MYRLAAVQHFPILLSLEYNTLSLSIILRPSRSIYKQSTTFSNKASILSCLAVSRSRCTTINDMDRASKVLVEASLEVYSI